MGPVVTGRDVRLAVEQTLKGWLPSALAHVCREAGMPPDALRVPDTYHRMVSATRLVEMHDRLPAVIIASPADDWSRDADGTYRTEWGVVVSVTSRAATFDETVDTNDLYRAAVRLALAEHSSLGGFASDLLVLGGGYEPIGEGDRTVMAGTVEMTVTVDSTMRTGYAPAAPPADPLAVPTRPTADTLTPTVSPAW